MRNAPGVEPFQDCLNLTRRIVKPLRLQTRKGAVKPQFFQLLAKRSGDGARFLSRAQPDREARALNRDWKQIHVPAGLWFLHKDCLGNPVLEESSLRLPFAYGLGCRHIAPERTQPRDVYYLLRPVQRGGAALKGDHIRARLLRPAAAGSPRRQQTETHAQPGLGDVEQLFALRRWLHARPKVYFVL